MARDDFYTSDNFEQEEYPPSWKPDVGDFLGGIVKRYSQGSTEYRGQVREHPIAIIEVEIIDGGADVRQGEEVGFWLLHTVALSKFEKLAPRPGERVGIRKVESPEGKDYHNYIVRVDRETEDEEVPDFSRFKTNASDHGHAPDEPRDPVEDTVHGTGPGAPGGGDQAPPPAGSGDDNLPF